MATRTWVGATSTTWTTTANWSEGSIPADTDDIVFGEQAVSAPDPIDQSSIDPASLTILEGYNFTFGTSGSAIILGTVTRLDVASGGSLVHLDATVTAAKLAIGAAQQVLCGGSWATVISSGSGKLDADTAVVDKLYYQGNRVVYGAGTKPTLISGMGGTLESSRNLGRVLSSNANSVRTTGTATVDEIQFAGVFNHRSSGTVTLAVAFPGGVYDPSGGKSHAVTTLYEAAGAKVLDQLAGVAVTITNREKLGYDLSGSLAGASTTAGVGTFFG